MADFKTFFENDYQGTEAFIRKIIIPVFGNGLVPANEDILQSNPNCKAAAERANILAIKRFGKYEFDVPMELFEITLSENVRISYSRVNIQALVRQLMETYSAALIVFHYPDNTGEWRVSYVSKGSNNHDATNAKRFTYLMGSDHKCRTAAERFTILADKEKTEKNITDAFSVEALSIDFFERYKNIYADFVEYITGKRYKKENGKWVEKTIHEPNKQLTSSFNGDEKAVRDFVKKMMGRLVFLQFLQRKGWLGVPLDKNWGEGNKDFLQDLFKNSNKKDDFLDEVLEPLLFETLNDGERPNDIADTRLGENIKIPYLNGGLFDSDELDKKKVVFPAALFGNLFQFFSEYNFTIDENDPNDAEVGVDPEMLGRIFENLLEDNKDKGAFYTPKEIVQYMCRESLIAYLTTDNEAWEDAIKTLVLQHKTDDLTAEQKRKLLAKLKAVKVCDPAIGSGAFPMGMLHEIYQCIIALDGTTTEKAAEIKKHIIQNSIYGVDLEKGAVDIARLRFWLALVVDEEKPQPLPNLDYKIMQGNSLLESFEGVDLSLIATNDLQIVEPQKDLFGNFVDNQLSISYTKSDDIKKLQLLTQHYFSTESHKQKDAIKKEIEKEIHKQIELKISKHIEGKVFELESLGEKSAMTPKQSKKANEIQQELAKIEDIKQKLIFLENSDSKPFFLWNLYFKDVFDKGGFDIVIGNPPYVQLQKNEGLLAKEYENQNFQTFERTGDIYSLFYEKGIQILKNKGTLTYITSNKWMRAGYGKKTRAFFCEHEPLKIIDLGSGVFETATVDTNILTIRKINEKPQKYALKALDISKERNIIDFNLFKDKWIILNNLSDDNWNISSNLEQRIKTKIETMGKPLKEWEVQIYRGVLTGFNEAFIIDGRKKNELIAEDPRSAEIIKPILRGRDIKRYKAEFADLWIINTHNGIKDKNIPRIDVLKDYPAVYKHLLCFEEQLKKRQDKGDHWTNLRNCAYIEEFEKEKIVYPETTQKSAFLFDNKKYYIEKTAFILLSKSAKYLVTIFNSKLFEWSYKNLFSSVTLGEKGFQFNKHAFLKYPVLNLSENKQNIFITLANQILIKSENNESTTALERQIDELVFKLYDLTYEEVLVVCPDFWLSEEEYEKVEIE